MKRRDFLQTAFATVLGYVIAPAAMQIGLSDYKWVAVQDDRWFHQGGFLTSADMERAFDALRNRASKHCHTVITSPAVLKRMKAALGSGPHCTITMSMPVPVARPRTPSGRGLRNRLRTSLDGS